MPTSTARPTVLVVLREADRSSPAHPMAIADVTISNPPNGTPTGPLSVELLVRDAAWDPWPPSVAVDGREVWKSAEMLQAIRAGENKQLEERTSCFFAEGGGPIGSLAPGTDRTVSASFNHTFAPLALPNLDRGGVARVRNDKGRIVDEERFPFPAASWFAATARAETERLRALASSERRVSVTATAERSGITGEVSVRAVILSPVHLPDARVAFGVPGAWSFLDSEGWIFLSESVKVDGELIHDEVYAFSPDLVFTGDAPSDFANFGGKVGPLRAGVPLVVEPQLAAQGVASGLLKVRVIGRDAGETVLARARCDLPETRGPARSSKGGLHHPLG